MKKIITGIVAGLAAITLVTGCSTNGEPAKSENSATGQQHLPNWQPGTGDKAGPAEILLTSGETSVLPIGLRDDSLAPPDDNIEKVAWYQDSAVPGSSDKGTIVITGHVNYAGKEGYADKFTKLKEGDIVTLRNGTGQEYQYRVKADPVLVPKSNPTVFNKIGDETFNRTTGEEALVLVTCSGEFIGGALGYESNSVVVATPVR